jgi:hypothetical protein
VGPGLRQLAPLHHVERQPVGRQPLAHAAQRRVQVGRLQRELAIHVRGRGERPRPGRQRRLRERDGAVEVGRPVVDAGQDVRVEVDHRRP